MADYIYPTNEELKLVEPDKIAALSATNPIFEHFPMVDVDSAVLSWEQRDNYTGLQAVRGMLGQPKRVKSVGGKRFTIEPGVYGEFDLIDELELTTRRPWGEFNGSVDISDLVMEKQDLLLGRRLDRIKKVLWDLAVAGEFSVLNEEGVQMYAGEYDTQGATALVSWATSGSAKPLADFRAIQLLSRGTSSSFGSQAVAYMNRVTFNTMISNTNTNDIAGRRTSGLTTVLNLDEVNNVFLGEGLPQIYVYDEGYLDDSNTFQPFIPNERVVIFGTRPGNQPVGDYAMTRNANNPNMEPGAYQKVVDNDDKVPRTIEVHDGHNGGPRLYYPGAIVVLDTTP